SVKTYLTFKQAQANGAKIDWSDYKTPKPTFTGTKIFNDYDLSELRKYIDWKPFFISWELHGNFPQILTDAKVGVEATNLYNDANALLDKIVKEKWVTAQGVVGF
ncbi:vitamin B12 dependent-methionine synthase activation domain-containing protein, partial [Rhizobium leguminosarum]|uniref:vitamin B12 dependent-methionine synthase activation domain-containing protein n=1 Tax=Rhizobium leguminosarum TaxID=384 RepID=UPI003F9CC9F7